MRFIRGEIRQGDVALVRVEDVELGKLVHADDRTGLVTLAQGESTGHHHSFQRNDRVALFRPDDILVGGVVVVKHDAVLEHQEHAPLSVPAGLYIQAVQVEDRPEAVTVVID